VVEFVSKTVPSVFYRVSEYLVFLDVFLLGCGPVDEHNHDHVLRYASNKSGQEAVLEPHNSSLDVNGLPQSGSFPPRVLVLSHSLDARF